MFVGGLRTGEIPARATSSAFFNENMEELRRESLLLDWRHRIRDVRQGPDGLLYVVDRSPTARFPHRACGVGTGTQSVRSSGAFNASLHRHHRFSAAAGSSSIPCFGQSTAHVQPVEAAALVVDGCVPPVPPGSRSAATHHGISPPLVQARHPLNRSL